MEVISSVACSYTPLSSKWMPQSNRFVSVGSYKDGKGVISIQELDQDLNCRTIRNLEFDSGFRCCSFGVEPKALRRLVTGQYNGNVSVFDLEHPQTPVWSAKEDTLINSVDTPFHSSRPEFLSTSRNGNVSLWDTRVFNSPVITLKSDDSTLQDCWIGKFGECIV